MRSVVIALVAPLLLQACASQTPYKPASKADARGYTETRLSSDHYRVAFSGNASTPADTTRDFALLRAAELTLQSGNDWFQLISRSTDKKTQTSGVDTGPDFVPQQTVYQRCGLLRCDTVVTTTPGYVGGFDSGAATTSNTYTSEVEIVVGKNPMPTTAESYDARQMVASLRRMLIKP
ncbi:CC0125/CC1285 family lipoprotein [Hydrocarboniphaga sp.]|uniref:CC0125/CC1285 family lipoprotein n=1 Tax=Hydrocarboniphaga sp. TaxID=2033016 RepID=UPI003D0ACECC